MLSRQRSLGRSSLHHQGTCAVSVHKELAPVGAEYLQSPEVWVWEGKDGARPSCKGS